MLRIQARLFAVAATIAIVFGACSDQAPTSPHASAGPSLLSGPSSTLLECPTDHSVTVVDTLGGLGAGADTTLLVRDHAGGTHEVIFPGGVIATPTLFTLQVPAAQHVKVRVIAQDLVTRDTLHLTFEDAQPKLAVSYKRCTRSNTTKGPLHLYNINEATGEVESGPYGAKEGNPDDPRVVGTVPHFSEYALGSP